MARLRYFIQGQQAPFEENTACEFKGHLNLSEDEVPAHANELDTNRRSRMPVSRTLNAFLNTGQGGTVYLGIVDTGEVQGVNLSRFKMDHLIVNLTDLMERYDPPVEKHRYKIRFVPVVPANSTPEEIERTVTFDSRKGVDKSERQRRHFVRSRLYCWCDKETQAKCSTLGEIPMYYVVEIVIKPWDPMNPANQNAVGQMKTWPIHQDECGKVYFRQQASLAQYSRQEIVEMSRSIVENHYSPEVDKLKTEIYRLRKSLPGGNSTPHS